MSRATPNRRIIDAMIRRPRLIAPLLLASFCLTGCWVPVKENETSSGKPITRTQTGGRQQGEPGRIEIPPGRTGPSMLDAIDPCGARLQEVGGALLLYY